MDGSSDLKRGEELASAILEHASAALFCLDDRGRILSANRAAAEYGIREGLIWQEIRGEIGYRPLEDDGWLDERGRVPIDRALAGLDYRDRFLIGLERHGRRRVLGVGIERITLSDGRLAVVVLAQDVTEERRTGERQSIALEAIADPVWIFDADGALVDRNSRAVEEAIESDTLVELERALDLRDWVEDRRFDSLSGFVDAGRELDARPVRTSDGSTADGRLVLLSIRPGSDGVGTVVTFSDVTELDRAQRRSDDQARQLEEFQRHWTDLSSRLVRLQRHLEKAPIEELRELERELEGVGAGEARNRVTRARAWLEELGRLRQESDGS